MAPRKPVRGNARTPVEPKPQPNKRLGEMVASTAAFDKGWGVGKNKINETETGPAYYYKETRGNLRDRFGSKGMTTKLYKYNSYDGGPDSTPRNIADAEYLYGNFGNLKNKYGTFSPTDYEVKVGRIPGPKTVINTRAAANQRSTRASNAIEFGNKAVKGNKKGMR